LSLFPFFVDFPTRQIDSIFDLEKPLSLLKMSKVDETPHPVMSFDVTRKSNDGATPSGYSLSSAF
jgi:hypothetical protein